jgi:nucleotide-binding universal stress UspA family protein
MSIVCGIDFSEHSASAATVAAELAVRMHAPLHLVHSIETLAQESPEVRRDALAARDQLEQQARKLRELGANVTTHVEAGPPDGALLALAMSCSAQWIVVASVGTHRHSTMQLGSHADRLSQRSHVPVLVVRDAAALTRWLRGERPLRVVLGVDFSLAARSAFRTVQQLRTLAPCEVIATHLYFPPTQNERLGLAGVRDWIHAEPEVLTVLARDLRRHLGADRMEDEAWLRVRLEPHLGRIGDRLATIADEEKADLLLVGSHARSDFDRFVEGSVSRTALHCARRSVACVPLAYAAGDGEPRPIRDVLVATDFSPIGNAAVAQAYAMAPEGATVHLVHVVKDRGHRPLDPHDVVESADQTDRVPEHAEARERLLNLIPSGTVLTNKATRLHILESNRVAEAICQAAERFDAGLICVGTHGRSGIAKTVLGSVAQSVVTQTQRPVLLIHAPLSK